MDYKTLTYFLTVYRLRNLSKAAEEIHISRQALSKCISNLEKTLNKELFIRNANGLIPTETADHMVPYAQKIIEGYTYMLNENAMAKLQEKRVTLCTFDACSQMFSADFFEGIISKHSNLMINIEETTDENAKNQLLLNECDFAIVTDAINYRDFNYTKLFHAPYGVFVGKNHPLAQKEKVYCRDLVSERIIGKSTKLKYYSRDVNHMFDQNISFDFRLELTNTGAARNLVRNNIAIAIAWDYTLLSHIDDGIVFCQVEDMCNGMDVYLIEKKNIELTSNKKLFKKYLLDWINQHIT